jgi:hypothetical protein
VRKKDAVLASAYRPEPSRGVTRSIGPFPSADLESVAMELRDMGDDMAIYVAKEYGATVGFGLVRYDRDIQFGGLFAGSTIPSARGRGVYRGMVGVRARDAHRRGARYLYTEAGPMSGPIRSDSPRSPPSQTTSTAPN